LSLLLLTGIDKTGPSLWGCSAPKFCDVNVLRTANFAFGLIEERRLQQMLATRLQRQLQQRDCQPSGAEAERERQGGGRLERDSLKFQHSMSS
jgi:hypothetical protein